MLCSYKSCPETVTNVCKYCHSDLCHSHSYCPRCQEESIRFMNHLHKYKTEYPWSSLLLEEHVFSDMTFSDIAWFAMCSFWFIHTIYCIIQYKELADGMIVSALVMVSTKLVMFITGELIRLRLTSFEDYIERV